MTDNDVYEWYLYGYSVCQVSRVDNDTLCKPSLKTKTAFTLGVWDARNETFVSSKNALVARVGGLLGIEDYESDTGTMSLNKDEALRLLNFIDDMGSWDHLEDGPVTKRLREFIKS